MTERLLDDVTDSVVHWVVSAVFEQIHAPLVNFYSKGHSPYAHTLTVVPKAGNTRIHYYQLKQPRPQLSGLHYLSHRPTSVSTMQSVECSQSRWKEAVSVARALNRVLLLV